MIRKLLTGLLITLLIPAALVYADPNAQYAKAKSHLRQGQVFARKAMTDTSGGAARTNLCNKALKEFSEAEAAMERYCRETKKNEDDPLVQAILTEIQQAKYGAMKNSPTGNHFKSPTRNYDYKEPESPHKASKSSGGGGGAIIAVALVVIAGGVIGFVVASSKKSKRKGGRASGRYAQVEEEPPARASGRKAAASGRRPSGGSARKQTAKKEPARSSRKAKAPAAAASGSPRSSRRAASGSRRRRRR